MHNDSQISLRGRFDLERAIAEDEAIDVSPVVERYHRQKQEELPSILPVFLPTVADIMDAQKEESEKYSRRGLDLERATPEERRRHRKKTICCWSMFAVIMFVFASGLVWFVFLSYHRPAPSADHTAGAASISSSRVSSQALPSNSAEAANISLSQASSHTLPSNPAEASAEVGHGFGNMTRSMS